MTRTMARPLTDEERAALTRGPIRRIGELRMDLDLTTAGRALLDPEPDSPWWLVLDPDGTRHPRWTTPNVDAICTALRCRRSYGATRPERGPAGLILWAADDPLDPTPNRPATAVLGDEADLCGPVAIVGEGRRRLTVAQAAELYRLLAAPGAGPAGTVVRLVDGSEGG